MEISKPLTPTRTGRTPLDSVLVETTHPGEKSTFSHISRNPMPDSFCTIPTDPHLISKLRSSANHRNMRSLLVGTGDEKTTTKVQRANSMLPVETLAHGFALRHSSPDQRLRARKGRVPHGRTKKEYCLGTVGKLHRKLGFNVKENLVVQLSSLGFSEEFIQSVVFGTNVERVEDALEYMVKDENENWGHTFIHEHDVMKKYRLKYCLACEQRASMAGSRMVSTHGRDRTRVVPAESRVVQFVKNGIAMKNQRYQQLVKRRRGHALRNNESLANISYISDAQNAGNEVSGVTSQKDLTIISRDRQLMNTSSARESFPSRILEECCFACGDELGSHSPDYNREMARLLLESSTEPTLRARQNLMTPTTASTSKSRIVAAEKKTVCCPICLETESCTLTKLLCGHKVCGTCLRLYIATTLDTVRRRSVKCPMPDCDYVFSNSYVEHLLGDGPYWLKYRARHYELALLADKKILYCPQCGKALMVEPSAEPTTASSGEFASLVSCENCREVICKKCGSEWHRGLTCAENVSQKYGRLVRGWEWQLCPTCKSPVHIASQCGHMMCKECFAVFCIYCRKRKHVHKRGKGEIEGMDFGCCLESPQMVSSVSGLGVQKSCFTAMLVYFLLLLSSPLLALLLVPYILIRNYRESLARVEWPLFAEKVPSLSSSMQPTVGAQQNCSVTEPQNSTFLFTAAGAVPTENSIMQFREGGGSRRTGRCLWVKLMLIALMAVVLSPVSLVVINVLAMSSLIGYIVFG